MEKICTRCNLSKKIDEFHNNKTGKYKKSNICKICTSENNKTRNKIEYQCPSCNKISLLHRNAFYNAVKEKKQCNSCAVKKWHIKKYGKREDREFTTNCPRCNKIKYHKRKNISPTQLLNIKNIMSKKLCLSCSNTLYHTLPSSKINTKPELKFKEILNELNINYIHNFKFMNYHFDFYLNDLDILVEIDGNYWHGKGLKENELNFSQQKSRKNDINKNQICVNYNKKLIRFWEDEISIDIIKEKIKI